MAGLGYAVYHEAIRESLKLTMEGLVIRRRSMNPLETINNDC